MIGRAENRVRSHLIFWCGDVRWTDLWVPSRIPFWLSDAAQQSAGETADTHLDA
jgi:hypothetical protein